MALTVIINYLRHRKLTYEENYEVLIQAELNFEKPRLVHKKCKKTFFVELDIAITYSHRCALKPFMEHFLVTHLFFTED